MFPVCSRATTTTCWSALSQAPAPAPEKGNRCSGSARCLGIIAIGRERAETRDAATPCVYRTTWNFVAASTWPTTSRLLIAVSGTGARVRAFHASRPRRSTPNLLIGRENATSRAETRQLDFDAIHLRDWCSPRASLFLSALRLEIVPFGGASYVCTGQTKVHKLK